MVCEERVFSESEGEKRSDACAEILFLTNWPEALKLLFLWTEALLQTQNYNYHCQCKLNVSSNPMKRAASLQLRVRVFLFVSLQQQVDFTSLP